MDSTLSVDRSPQVDIREARAGTLREVYPFTEFVVKIFERCNIACTYCYMYEMADQSWRQRPANMSAEIFETFAVRVGEHVKTHRLPKISLVFHGGEPLLRGREFIGWAAALVRSGVGGINVDIRVQTNGILLDARMLNVFDEHDIKVGVSLDGPRHANDRQRLDKKGASSFDATVAGITRLTADRYRRLFRGLYATVDVRNDPVETFEFLQSFDPPMIDFLLPHGNWETPPPHRVDGSTSYGDWLTAVFDRWYLNTNHTIDIRLFHNVIVGLLGGISEVESIGLSPVRSVFVETDGSINQVDSLKSAFEGATATDLDIIANTFDDAMHCPSIRARQVGRAGLSQQCRQCQIVDVCGGGYYPHRYRPDNGFDNPSVYCDDLTRLIGHIRQRMHDDVLKSVVGTSAS